MARVDAHYKVMTPSQSRAARAILGLSQQRLGPLVGVSGETIKNFEAGQGTPLRMTLATIRRGLEDRGFVFIDEDGRRGLSWPED